MPAKPAFPNPALAVLCAATATFTAASVCAALPPKYLDVPQFQACLGERPVGSYLALCLPEQRPAPCPEDSWRQLRELQGADAIEPCVPRPDKRPE